MDNEHDPVAQSDKQQERTEVEEAAYLYDAAAAYG